MFDKLASQLGYINQKFIDRGINLEELPPTSPAPIQEEEKTGDENPKLETEEETVEEEVEVTDTEE